MNIEQYVDNKKYLVDIYLRKNFEKEELGYQAYYIACMFESDVNILKLIIKKKYLIDVYKPVADHNAFVLACLRNPNVNIIKFLVNDLKFDIHFDEDIGYIVACAYNKNIDVIKYINQDLYKGYLNNIYEYGLYNAIRQNNDVKIIEYLFEKFQFNPNDIQVNQEKNFMNVLLV